MTKLKKNNLKIIKNKLKIIIYIYEYISHYNFRVKYIFLKLITYSRNLSLFVQETSKDITYMFDVM